MDYRKMIAAAGALVCAAAVADGITSDNVVGYQTQDLDGKQYNSVGATFLSVGSEKVKLGSLTANGFQYDTDILQVLSTENASTTAMYTYVTPEWDEEDFEGDGAAVGWWIKGKEGEDGYSANDVELDLGTGLLGNFPHKKVVLQSSGEVKAGSTQLNLAGKQYNMVANFLPTDIKLGDVVAEGFQYDTDILQALSTENASTAAMYTYVTEAWDAEDFEGDGAAVGWWIKGQEGEDGFSANNVAWPAGQAFLGNFPHKQVKMTFPAAIE